MKQCIISNDAPKPVGPYSHAVMINNMLFLSGQLPINPQSGKIEGDTIEEQTRLVLNNIKAILESANLTLDDVVKVNVYISDLSLFAKFNEVYSEYFKSNYPARTTIGCQLLPGVMVEIDAVAGR
ncbi:RidA family protein [Caldicellulosiruptoraceae bacterium PP1]